jgi:hypothetical protein
MNETTIAVTRFALSDAAAKRLQSALTKLDDDMTFVGPVDIAGNELHGWIVRDNDGTSGHPDEAARGLLLAAVEEAKTVRSAASKRAAMIRKFASYRD